MNMRASNFALRLQPSLLEELRSMSDLEGVAVNQLINVAIAEKLAQMRTAKWFADRIAAASPKAGAQLIRDLSRGGGGSLPAPSSLDTMDCSTTRPRPN